jgi:cytochrome c oxidase subunit 2
MRASGLLGSASFPRRLVHLSRLPKVVRVVGTGLGASLVLGACNLPTFAINKGATTQGRDTFHLFQLFTIISIPVLLSVFIPLGWAIFRYRKKDESIPKQTHSHIPVEVTWTVIPILIVAFLFVLTVQVENKVTAVSSHPNLRVNVVGFQWGWKFNYPSFGVTKVTQGVGGSSVYPQLVLPEGETTTIHLVSNDVVHGFYVPQFDFSRYALPGVNNYFDFTPTQTGTFIGRCSQLCGLYHSEMLFTVRVVTPAQFNSWISQQSHNTIGA